MSPAKVFLSQLACLKMEFALLSIVFNSDWFSPPLVKLNPFCIHLFNLVPLKSFSYYLGKVPLSNPTWYSSGHWLYQPVNNLTQIRIICTSHLGSWLDPAWHFMSLLHEVLSYLKLSFKFLEDKCLFSTSFTVCSCSPPPASRQLPHTSCEKEY